MVNKRIGVKAILFDLGDVIMKEATEGKDHNGVTLTAELVPGARETLVELRERGYRLALVADTKVGTYQNVLKQHGLFDLFETFAISEEVGCLKPDPRIFKTALTSLNISEKNYNAVIMVGNNLERDINGANRLGLISVWSNWNRQARYRSKPAEADQFPDYTIGTLPGLLEIIEPIERGLIN